MHLVFHVAKAFRDGQRACAVPAFLLGEYNLQREGVHVLTAPEANPRGDGQVLFFHAPNHATPARFSVAFNLLSVFRRGRIARGFRDALGIGQAGPGRSAGLQQGAS